MDEFRTTYTLIRNVGGTEYRIWGIWFGKVWCVGLATFPACCKSYSFIGFKAQIGDHSANVLGDERHDISCGACRS